MYSYKNFCVYFTHLPGSPPWRDLHKILRAWSPRRRNQSCQILSQSGQGFRFCGGSNFWLSHKKEKSPLTQGLNYRSACDPVCNTSDKMHNIFANNRRLQPWLRNKAIAIVSFQFACNYVLSLATDRDTKMFRDIICCGAR